MPGYTQSDNEWLPDAKLAAVIETVTLSETELGAYCREKGLYPEQIQQWEAACLKGAGQQEHHQKPAQQQRKEDRKTIKQLKAEVRRKDRALAETTSLLVLSKSSTPCHFGQVSTCAPFDKDSASFAPTKKRLPFSR